MNEPLDEQAPAPAVETRGGDRLSDAQLPLFALGGLVPQLPVTDDGCTCDCGCETAE